MSHQAQRQIPLTSCCSASTASHKLLLCFHSVAQAAALLPQRLTSCCSASTASHVNKSAPTSRVYHPARYLDAHASSSVACIVRRGRSKCMPPRQSECPIQQPVLHWRGVRFLHPIPRHPFCGAPHRPPSISTSSSPQARSAAAAHVACLHAALARRQLGKGHERGLPVFERLLASFTLGCCTSPRFVFHIWRWFHAGR